MPRRRWIVGLVIVLLLGWAVAATVSFVFFPTESEEPSPSTVTVETTVTLEQS